MEPADLYQMFEAEAKAKGNMAALKWIYDIAFSAGHTQAWQEAIALDRQKERNMEQMGKDIGVPAIIRQALSMGKVQR